MEFLVKINENKAKLMLDTGQKVFQKEIASDKSFSEKLLPEIDAILQKAGLKQMPVFKVKCSQGASKISCNVAKATIKALNIK